MVAENRPNHELHADQGRILVSRDIAPVQRPRPLNFVFNFMQKATRMRRSLFFLFILTIFLTGCPRQQPQAGKGQPFLDAKQDVPPGLEWSRDIIAKNPGTIKVRVVSQGPMVVMAMSARVWQATQANTLRSSDRSELYLNADVKETTFEREINVPAGSTYIMINNKSDKQTTIHLQVFSK